MKFGDKLSILRKKERLSQEELGDKLRVTRQTVSKWELGQSKPDTDKLMELSKLFNVDFNILADDEVLLENKTTNENANIDTTISENSDEIRPRKWLLVVLIVVAIVIVIFLLNGYVNNRKTAAEKMEEEVSSFFDIFTNIINKVEDATGLDTDTNLNIQVYNNFEQYEGTKLGNTVENMLEKVVTNNKKNTDKLITIVFNETETSDTSEITKIKHKLDTFTDYEVSLDYDDKGNVNKITIEEIIEEEKITDFDIRSFNNGYELYAGTAWGSTVSTVLDKIITNNKTKPERTIRVIYESTNTIDENEIRNIKNKLDKWKTDYEVILDYDDIGFVNQVTIQN